MSGQVDCVEIDVQDLPLLENITICKPRKTDDSLFGKIHCNEKQLNIHLYNVEVVKHKKVKHHTNTYSIVFLKVSKGVCKSFVDFDATCIELVRSNITNWFAKTFDENVIEEYYSPSVSICKSQGFMLKLKLQGSNDTLDNGKYDLVVGLKGLRFYKQRFIPEWEIVNVQVVGEDFLNSLQSDEEPSWEDEEDVAPEPTAEELQAIYNNIREKVDSTLLGLKEKYKSVKAKIHDLENILSELENNEKSIVVLDKLSERADNLCADV